MSPFWVRPDRAPLSSIREVDQILMIIPRKILDYAVPGSGRRGYRGWYREQWIVYLYLAIGAILLLLDWAESPANERKAWKVPNSPPTTASSLRGSEEPRQK